MYIILPVADPSVVDTTTVIRSFKVSLCRVIEGRTNLSFSSKGSSGASKLTIAIG